MRLYLGELKTPYNKQKLIEELSAFLRKPETKNSIKNLISSRDKKILSAIAQLLTPNFLSIHSLVAKHFTKNELSLHLENLEERLLIFKNQTTNLYSINPLLEETLIPFTNINNLLGETECSEKISQNEEHKLYLTDTYIASFINFTLSHSDLIKDDGELKKKAFTYLDEIFGENQYSITTLIKSLRNLGIFLQKEKALTVDWELLQNFSKLDKASRYAYFCVASSGHYWKSALKKYADELITLLNAIPQTGYTVDQLLILDILFRERKNINTTHSRLSQIFSNANSSVEDIYGNDSKIIETALQTCAEIGLLKEKGFTKNGDKIFTFEKTILQDDNIQTEKKVLSLDAGFNITLMPGLNIEDLTNIIKVIDIKKYDTACTFEITKASIERGFDIGYSPCEIINILSNYSIYPVPENLKISIQEWEESYIRGKLYTGTFIKLNPQNAEILRHSKKFMSNVQEEVYPGLFLLNSQLTEDSIKKILRENEIHTYSGPKEKTFYETSGLFENLKNDEPLIDIFFEQSHFAENLPSQKDTQKLQKQIIEKLTKELKQKKLPQNQEEVLQDRINKRIIIDASQLRGESVRFEHREAGGMDFTGKLHITESAIQEQTLLEILLTGSKTAIIGTPLSVDRHADYEVHLQLKNGQGIQRFFLREAVYVKKVRETLRFD